MLSVVSGSIVSGERCEVSGLRTVGVMDARKLCDGFVLVRMLMGGYSLEDAFDLVWGHRL